MAGGATRDGADAGGDDSGVMAVRSRASTRPFGACAGYRAMPAKIIGIYAIGGASPAPVQVS